MPGPPADRAEVLFLLVQALHDTPGFASLAAAVAGSAAAQQLLPGRYDVHGERTCRRRLQGVPAAACPPKPGHCALPSLRCFPR